MDLIPIFRFLLIPTGIVSILLAVKLIKPPKGVIFVSLSLCWVAGLLNLLVDIVEQGYGFWHYSIDHLVFGYPIDLYLAVSLILGCTVPLIYWWLRIVHKNWATPFVFLLPFYLLSQDYLAIKITADAVVVWQSPYWWVIDFVALNIIVWGTILVFRYFLLRDPEASIHYSKAR